MDKQICAVGIWDSSIPGIKFDGNGVSNFCKLQQKMMEQYPRGEKGANDWQEIVKKMKQTGKGKNYDCIVGVSGGVDSSNLLLVLKNSELRPLAVNLDNGFNSKIAVQNIFNVTKALNIDLETYVIDYQEVKSLLRSYMKASLPWIDTPTDLAIKAVMYKYALKEGVRYIIRGNDFRSEGKQPRDWTYADARQLKHIYNRFEGSPRLKTFPKLSLFKMIYAGMIRKIMDIRPYYYIEYSKQEVKKMLTEKFNWQDYGGHHHENLFTKFAMAYWLPQKFGIDKRIINLSAQVLSNQISRDNAVEQILQPFASDKELIELRDYVIKKLDLSENEFEKIWSNPNKNIFDYPSNYNLIYKYSAHLKPLLARLYSYTPMSVTAHNLLEEKK
jgi:N-acetyl sugar amidotransferase